MRRSSQRRAFGLGAKSTGSPHEVDKVGRRNGPEVPRGCSPENLAGVGITELEFGRESVPQALFDATDLLWVALVAAESWGAQGTWVALLSRPVCPASARNPTWDTLEKVQLLKKNTYCIHELLPMRTPGATMQDSSDPPKTVSIRMHSHTYVCACMTSTDTHAYAYPHASTQRCIQTYRCMDIETLFRGAPAPASSLMAKSRVCGQSPWSRQIVI